ncbi:MAG: hypothetical protein P8Z73_12495, partial [Desulfobacteraceae bacterium]
PDRLPVPFQALVVSSTRQSQSYFGSGAGSSITGTGRPLQTGLVSAAFIAGSGYLQERFPSSGDGCIRVKSLHTGLFTFILMKDTR